jgi:hypothetical protein
MESPNRVLAFTAAEILYFLLISSGSGQFSAKINQLSSLFSARAEQWPDSPNHIIKPTAKILLSY